MLARARAEEDLGAAGKFTPITSYVKLRNALEAEIQRHATQNDAQNNASKGRLSGKLPCSQPSVASIEHFLKSFMQQQRSCTLDQLL